MVTVEKVMDDKNGRRSQGLSSNGNISDNSMDSSDYEPDNGMRIGEDFQARVPDFNPEVKYDVRAEAMLVWAPHPELTDAQIDEYVLIAKERHGYNMEQALGMLFWHKHHVERALTDLANFTPFPDEWTVEDKVLFEQAFSFHGKSFHRIRQMLPDKSIPQLVKYYYSWKKTRSRTSLMDRQARKIIAKGDSDEDTGSESDTENKPGNPVKEESKLRPGPASKKYELHPRKNKHKRKPPRGMYLTQPDLLALATGPPTQGEMLLNQLNAELVMLKQTVQNNKQCISGLRAQAVGGIESFKPPESALKVNARWTSEESLLAVQGVRTYGKNFRAIAEVLGNKAESHVRNFFVNQRGRYNLDEVLLSYEQENGVTPSKQDDVVSKQDTEENMDTDETKPEVDPPVAVVVADKGDGDMETAQKVNEVNGPEEKPPPDDTLNNIKIDDNTAAPNTASSTTAMDHSDA